MSLTHSTLQNTQIVGWDYTYKQYVWYSSATIQHMPSSTTSFDPAYHSAYSITRKGKSFHSFFQKTTI